MIVSYFEVLKLFELKPGFTDDQLKTAYRRLAHKHHPDKGGSAENFKNIKEAHDFLLKHRNDKPAAPNSMNVATNYGNVTIRVYPNYGNITWY